MREKKNTGRVASEVKRAAALGIDLVSESDKRLIAYFAADIRAGRWDRVGEGTRKRLRAAGIVAQRLHGEGGLRLSEYGKKILREVHGG